MKNIKEQFPILQRKINGKPIIYLDNSATTQKSQTVIDALTHYYSYSNANIHRSSHVLAKEATEQWLNAHQIVANFLNASSYKEIVFVRNSTEGLNLLVNTFGRSTLQKGDIVILSGMEHHSNIVPWIILQKEIGFEIRYIPVNNNFDLDIDWLEEQVRVEGKRIRCISVVHVSNVLGTRNPVKEIAEIGHRVGAFVIVDAAQSIPHMNVDVKEIDCDALVFSGHKVYGPTGSGALYCKEKYLESFPPFMGGGEMILRVSRDSFEMNQLPWKFEAGTPDIADGIVLGTTLEWFSKEVEEMGGWESLRNHDIELISEVFEKFDGIEWFKPFGKKDAKERYGVLAFNLDGFSFKGCKEKELKKEADGIVEYISSKGICVREGYHCAEPLHDMFKVGPTMRASVGIYNDIKDIDEFCDILKESVLSSY